MKASSKEPVSTINNTISIVLKVFFFCMIFPFQKMGYALLLTISSLIKGTHVCVNQCIALSAHPQLLPRAVMIFEMEMLRNPDMKRLQFLAVEASGKEQNRVNLW